jgi:hypothetical protein
LDQYIGSYPVAPSPAPRYRAQVPHWRCWYWVSGGGGQCRTGLVLVHVEVASTNKFRPAGWSFGLYLVTPYVVLAGLREGCVACFRGHVLRSTARIVTIMSWNKMILLAAGVDTPAIHNIRSVDSSTTCLALFPFNHRHLCT